MISLVLQLCFYFSENSFWSGNSNPKMSSDNSKIRELHVDCNLDKSFSFPLDNVSRREEILSKTRIKMLESRRKRSSR